MHLQFKYNYESDTGIEVEVVLNKRTEFNGIDKENKETFLKEVAHVLGLASPDGVVIISEPVESFDEE